MSRIRFSLKGRATRLVKGNIQPGAGWDGTAGSGAAAPALDTSLQGSGFFCHPTGNMLEVPGTWIGIDGIDDTPIHPITVHADTSDAAGIKEVRVYMEGGSVVIRDRSWNPLHRNYGHVFTPFASSSIAGEANVVIDIVPVNGYIRRIGPYPLTLNTNGLISRPQVYVDPVNGTDDLATGRGQSPGNPWRSVQYALRQCTDASGYRGAIVRLAPGRYIETVNPINTQRNANNRQIAVAPYVGRTVAETVFAWAGREVAAVSGSRTQAGAVELAARLLRMHVQVDAGTVFQWYPPGVGTHWHFTGGLIDSNGSCGESDSDPALKTAWEAGGILVPFAGRGYWTSQQLYFRPTEGGCCYVTECDSVHYVLTGARGVRNVNHTGTFDNLFVTNSPVTSGSRTWNAGDDTWVSNYVVYLPGGYPAPIHKPAWLTVTGAVHNGLNTILTVAESLIGLGTPGQTSATWSITARNSSQPFQAYKWLTGANIGRSSGGAGFESSSFNEANGNSGAHLKVQWGYSAGKSLTVSGATWTCTSHALERGAPILFYTTGTLPAGISAGVTYYVSGRNLAANSFEVAASQADALASANSIAATDVGTGTHSFESRCIVVNGDFSTATGGTNVGDKIRGYITAHADPIQFTRATASNMPNVQNLTVQSYLFYGPGIGNQWLIQTGTAAALSRDASGNFTNAVVVTAAAGGTSFSVPPSTGLWVNDFLRVATVGHAAYGEAVRVLSYDSASGTGTLARPFSAALVASPCIQCKSAYGVSWQNVIIANTDGIAGVTGQWQSAVANFTVRQCTIVARAAGVTTPNTSEFLLRNQKGTNIVLTDFGCEAFLAIDSIVESMSAEDVWPAEARVVNVRRRRRPGSGAPPPLDQVSSIGDVVFDQNWRPDYGAEIPQLIQGPASLPWGLILPNAAELSRRAFSNLGAVP